MGRNGIFVVLNLCKKVYLNGLKIPSAWQLPKTTLQLSWVQVDPRLYAIVVM